MNERTLGLIGDEACKKLKNAKILLVGVGGVGGYVAEILGRSMVSSIILVDGDIVEESNINRQLVATNSTIGKYKVDVMKERILDIDPSVNVITYNKRFNQDSCLEIFNNEFDYIVDAIDSTKDKVLLVKKAKKHNKYIISAMGAGNRFKLQKYSVKDIYSTKYDPLARKMRNLLKKENILSLDVCSSDESVDIKSNITYSMGHNPALMGITLAGHILEKIILDNLD